MTGVQTCALPISLQIDASGYEMVIGIDGGLLVRSLLTDGQTKNPNFKNYIYTQNKNDATEKGHFPLSSRYKDNIYNIPPNLNNTQPTWNFQDKIYSYGTYPITSQYIDNSGVLNEGYKYPYENNNNFISKYNISTECGKRNRIEPYWEAKIHYTGISPLITPNTSNNPINVYLNYQYLPTSTEYHQHYFGFESEAVRTENGTHVIEPYRLWGDKLNNKTYKQITTLKEYEIFDNENLTYINENFTDATYSIIKHNDFFDNTNAIKINHLNIFDVNLDKIKITNNCLWEKNECQKYWTYTPQGSGAAYLNINLKANTMYVLKYFMYIPQETEIEDDSCYIEVESYINDEITTIGKLTEVFQKQDKNLRNQWIYHEIPFFTGEIENRLKIKGPQHNDENDVIHFYSIQIAESVEYSPTLKYTETGLYLVEDNKYISKPLEDVEIPDCAEYKNSHTKWTDNLVDTNIWINKGTEQLPMPLNNVYILFNDEFDIIYNKTTTELSYIKSNLFKFNKFNENNDEELSWINDPNDSIALYYNTNDEKGELYFYNTNQTIFTTGKNNEFFLKITDSNQNPINDGYVECSIWQSDLEDDTPCTESDKCLGISYPDENGIVYYKNLDFQKFKNSQNEYFLRMRYINDCYKKNILQWKQFIFTTEYCNIIINTDDINEVAKSIYANNTYERTSKQCIISSNDLPLPLHIFVTDQNNNQKTNGYCELSINDKVIESIYIGENHDNTFYLNEEDLKNDSQVIKIEYFIKPNESINFVYFTVNKDT